MIAEELAFFARTGAYGLGLAVVYWFVSYDVTGTVLLGMFGAATAAAFVLLWRPVRGSPRAHAERPFGDETGAIPLRSLAPLWLGAGFALLGLGLVYGLWFVVAAALPITAGARAWLVEVRDELRLVDREDDAHP